MNIQGLDKYLTTEPDNGYIRSIEKIWECITEEEISGDEYNKYDYFFSFWEIKLSTSGTHGFPKLDFCVQVIKRRYRFLKYLLAENWIMEEPNLFVNPVDGKKYKIDIAYEISWDYKNKNNLK